MTKSQVVPIKPLYVFILNDGGLYNQILVDSVLEQLAARAMLAIDNYLTTFGYRENTNSTPTTEDGFAHIYRAIGGSTETAVTIWTYKFDGDQTLLEAGDILDEAIVDELCSQFMADNADHFILPGNYVKGETEGIMQILWEDFDDPTLQRAFNNPDFHIYTVIDAEGGLYLLPGYHYVNRYGYILVDRFYDIGEGFRLESKESINVKEEIVC